MMARMSKVLSLSDLMTKTNFESVEFSSLDEPEVVRDRLKAYLDDFGSLEISLKNVRSLSPSFAYRAIAALFDSEADIRRFDEVITFVDDDRNLVRRIRAAMDRRMKVLGAERQSV